MKRTATLIVLGAALVAPSVAAAGNSVQVQPQVTPQVVTSQVHKAQVHKVQVHKVQVHKAQVVQAQLQLNRYSLLRKIARADPSSSIREARGPARAPSSLLYRPTMSSGRTGTRVSRRPVASRSAATIAAVETTVGGSPTPLTP